MTSANAHPTPVPSENGEKTGSDWLNAYAEMPFGEICELPELSKEIDAAGRLAHEELRGRFHGLVVTARSVFVWFTSAVLMLVFVPIIGLIWITERNPYHPRTSRWVRLLSRLSTRVNPLIRLHVDGRDVPEPTRTYVLVANHQSLTDIPLLSHLPLTMKWVAKASLFKVPLLGHLMRWSGDIPVNFRSPNRKAEVMDPTSAYIERGYNVIFFPEGKRSIDGEINKFYSGAFELAIATGAPILPIALDGLWDFLPVHSWKFGGKRDIRLKILPPIETTGLTVCKEDIAFLREKVRYRMIDQLAAWRGVPPETIDGLLREPVRSPSGSE